MDQRRTHSNGRRPDHLRSAISFSRTSNILNLIRYTIQYISHSPFNVGNASLFVCQRGGLVACAQCATKQTFVQSRIFLEGTLMTPCSSNNDHHRHHMPLLGSLSKDLFITDHSKQTIFTTDETDPFITDNLRNGSVMNVVCYERVCYEQICYEQCLFRVVCYEQICFERTPGY